MRLPRIYHAGPLAAGVVVTLEAGAASHVRRVLRLETGDALVLFDGRGSNFDATIDHAGRGGVSVRVGAVSTDAAESPLRITLLQGLCRAARMDLLIRQSVELGVTGIRPLISERTVVRLDGERARKKLAHWRGIAIAACEQSGRARLPDIASPTILENALATGNAEAARIMLDPAGSTDIGGCLNGARAVSLLIGPEGGLTDAESDRATAAGYERVALGPRILRTETAPLAAISILQYLNGDFRVADGRGRIQTTL